MTQSPAAPNPANRLGIDYRSPPGRKTPIGIIDVHTHVYECEATPLMWEAARLYGVTHLVSMTPLAELDAVRRRFGSAIDFIAIPHWKEMSSREGFRDQWIADLRSFHERGARLCKLWMAPKMRKEFGLTAKHPFLRPVLDVAAELRFDLMIHAGDPSVWFAPGARYEDEKVYGTKADQFEQVEWLAEHIAPRRLIGAHMGGCVEELEMLQGLLDRHDNYFIDSSATKWIVREVARQPEAVRAFILRNADRILFGSDLVVRDEYKTFDHYASRYWAHRMMWESDYRGESPIDDPDADDPPKLAGVDLPAEILHKVYRENAIRLGLVSA